MHSRRRSRSTGWTGWSTMRNPYEEDVAGTDWSRLTVGQMWEALGDFDHEPASRQSGGWDRAFELLDYHRARLEEYRDLVAARWRGATAEAFLAEFSGLIDAVKALRDVALANAPVLPHLSASIVEARAALAPVHERWVANQAALAGSGSAPSAGGVPQPSPGPVAVSPGAQDRLHAQAVDIMATFSDRVIEGYQAIKIPPDYKPDGFVGILPHDPAAPAGAGSAGPGGGAPPPSRSSSVSGGAAMSAPGSGGGSLLAGGPAPSGSTTVPGPGAAGSGGGGGGVPVVGRVIGVVPPVPGGGATAVSRGAGWANPRGRALRPGGVINGPGLGFEPATPVRPADPRANPVGGVIGPTTGHESEAMMAPPVGGAGGRLGDQRRRGRNPDYDSNEHWPVPKGVPPVLGLPGPEPQHDPGIPVIGQPRQRRDR